MNINTKSNFLAKKMQERKKTEDQIESKIKAVVVQKNIRAFLDRQKLIRSAYDSNDAEMVLLLGSDISKLNKASIDELVGKILTSG